MKIRFGLSLVGVALIGGAGFSASAQNAATTDGKAAATPRVEAPTPQIARSGRPIAAESPAQAKDEAIAREIYLREAQKRGLDATEHFKNQLELARQSLLMRELFVDLQKSHPVSEDEIKAEYEKLVAANGTKDFRARHILVEKEDEANAVLVSLKNGEKFEDIAKKQSKDPGSANKGGELEWAGPGRFVKEFSEAMTKLTVGQMTEVPVKSQFGYHIIRLDDIREAQVPKLDELRLRIMQQLQQQKFTRFLEELRAKAKID